MRIGDSPAAPLLTLIVGPGEDKTIIWTGNEDMAKSDRRRLQFWTELLAKLKQRGDTLHSHLRPQVATWIAAGAGKTGLSFQYVLADQRARVELYIDTFDAEENRRLFDLLAEEREAIEKSFGGELGWHAPEGTRAKRIVWETETGGLKTPDRWPALQDELIDAMGRLAAALKPHIERMK